ncbi:MAG: hypothetical protein PHH77_10755 [Victivallaceae bacterium]|nr:hypothetical protein [Victivallaceae bacterium]
MKRFSVLVLLVGLLLAGTSVQVYGSRKKAPKTNPAKAAKYQQEAKNYEAEAQKAEQAGQQEVAALYRDCAQCNVTMSNYYSGQAGKNEAREAFKKLRENLRQIKKLQSKGTEENKKSEGNADEQAAQYQKRAEKCKKYAESLRTKGNTEGASYYDKLSDALAKLAEAAKSNNSEELKKAQQAYDELKKAKK